MCGVITYSVAMKFFIWASDVLTGPMDFKSVIQSWVLQGHSGAQTHISNQHATVMRFYFLLLLTPATPTQEINTTQFFFCTPPSFWSIRSKKTRDQL